MWIFYSQYLNEYKLHYGIFCVQRFVQAVRRTFTKANKEFLEKLCLVKKT